MRACCRRDGRSGPHDLRDRVRCERLGAGAERKGDERHEVAERLEPRGAREEDHRVARDLGRGPSHEDELCDESRDRSVRQGDKPHQEARVVHRDAEREIAAQLPQGRSVRVGAGPRQLCQACRHTIPSAILTTSVAEMHSQASVRRRSCCDGFSGPLHSRAVPTATAHQPSRAIQLRAVESMLEVTEFTRVGTADKFAHAAC